MIWPVGTLINALTIIVGSLLGLALGNRLPERMRSTVFQVLGLFTLFIGFKMTFGNDEESNSLIIIISLALGAITGELLCLEERLNQLGNLLSNLLKRFFPSKSKTFTEGFVNASILFCVGAMAIVGSFEEAINGDRSTLITKSTLDGFTSIFFAANYGVGVLFSFILVLIYQSSLTLFASNLKPLLSPDIIANLTVTGGILIMGIGFNLLNIKTIPITNLLPALIYVCLATSLISVI